MKIYPNDGKLQYSGRIDFSNPVKPIFVFPCTSVKMRFSGNELKICVENRKEYWDNYLGYILDGVQGRLKLPDNGLCTLEIPILKQADIHEILLFKRQDSCHEVVFHGFELAEGARVFTLPEKSKRRIEVYGDSVSAGEVSEAIDYVGKEDPEHNGEYSNSWYSYAWMTARKLDADIHDIAQGGIALLDHTGWFCAPDYIGMESVWDKVHYHPGFGAPTTWDFNAYQPQVVILAIGQNDSHPNDYMKEAYDCAEAVYWRKRYEEFIRKLREVYPDAWIILSTTILCHDEAWDRAIEAVCRETRDEKLRHFMYTRNGTGTPGHIRISEAEEMSDELAAYIKTLDVEGWERSCKK